MCHAIWSLKGPGGLHFSLSKSFDHITKGASLFHLKLSGNHKLNYFLTSTPSRHLPSPWPIYCKPSLFDIEIWMTYHIQLIMDMERFSHLLWTNLTSYHFSLFFNFTPLYIFLIYDVFFSKALQDLIGNMFSFIFSVFPLWPYFIMTSGNYQP